MIILILLLTLTATGIGFIIKTTLKARQATSKKIVWQPRDRIGRFSKQPHKVYIGELRTSLGLSRFGGNNE